MNKENTNLAASVRQRLLNRAKETNRPFDELLQYFAMERFLYRLSRSSYKSRVVLKGALMFVVWQAPHSRATRDIDLLGRMPNDVDGLVTMAKQICQVEVEPDGIVFNIATVTGERIKEDADYEGARLRFTGNVGQARVYMQIDIAFGDTLFPKPVGIDYPTLLGMPHAQLKGYPRETVVAEKFEAMVQLGMLNSRMKDFYDIWLLAQQFDFDGKTLKKAIEETFANRGTVLTAGPLALSDEFANDREKAAQWTAFIRTARLDHAPSEFQAVIELLRDFLLPIATAVAERETTPSAWKAPGPWKY